MYFQTNDSAGMPYSKTQKNTHRQTNGKQIIVGGYEFHLSNSNKCLQQIYWIKATPHQLTGVKKNNFIPIEKIKNTP